MYQVHVHVCLQQMKRTVNRCDDRVTVVEVILSTGHDLVGQACPIAVDFLRNEIVHYRTATTVTVVDGKSQVVLAVRRIRQDKSAIEIVVLQTKLQ